MNSNPIIPDFPAPASDNHVQPSGPHANQNFKVTNITDPPWSQHALKLWDALDSPPQLAGQSSDLLPAATLSKHRHTTKAAIESATKLNSQLKLGGRVDVVRCLCNPGIFTNVPAIAQCRKEFLGALSDWPNLRCIVEVEGLECMKMLLNDSGKLGYPNICLALKVGTSDNAVLEWVEKFKKIPAKHRMLILGPGAMLLNLTDALEGINWIAVNGGPLPSDPANDPVLERSRALRDKCVGKGIAYLYHRNGEVVELDGRKWQESSFGAKVDLSKPAMKGSKLSAALATAPMTTAIPAVPNACTSPPVASPVNPTVDPIAPKATVSSVAILPRQDAAAPMTTTSPATPNDEVVVTEMSDDSKCLPLLPPATLPVKARKPWSPPTIVQPVKELVMPVVAEAEASAATDDTAAPANLQTAVPGPPSDCGNDGDHEGDAKEGTDEGDAAIDLRDSVEDEIQLEDKANMHATAAPSTAVGKVQLPPVKVEVEDKVPAILTTEVMAEISPEICDEIRAVECLIDKLVEMPTTSILKSIKEYSGRAADFAKDTIRTSTCALVCAWACGRLLLVAKGKMKHGEFTPWCEANISAIMSATTKQRYMRLAENFNNVRDLLTSGSTLRQAYIGLGILPKPEKSRGQEDAPTQTCHLLKTIKVAQKKLQRIVASKEKLETPERQQLRTARKELDTLLDIILG